jgi:DNA-binding CsgD family transcriptional regulator
VLRGRHSECETLDRLLRAVRSGESRVLVVRGESGVGKTALLAYAIESASDFRVVRAIGVESEMELAFAALHQLCAPMLDRLERLPGPQRDALGTAFGLRAGNAPDRFLVGLAVLSLLSGVAEEQPLMCSVDDAQWLDRASAQALTFVARRLLAESVAVVFATRAPSEEFKGLPELVVEGLGGGDARALLDSVLAGPLDDEVRERIVAETRGNPLALLELPRGLTSAELAGGFGLPDALPLSGRIEESFRRRLVGFPPETRRLLLVAAAEPVGEPVLMWRAAERLGLGIDAAAPATAAGLCEFGARVRFRHPLVRSAVKRAASPDERRRVHAALAAATDPAVDPDRRAWHRAEATPGPDEDVADELERSAGRAQARGGLGGAGAFFARGYELTLEPAQRAERALAAAHAKYEAGAPEAAVELLSAAEAGPLDELQRARLERLRARTAFITRRGSEAPLLLLGAAKRLEALDVGAARETHLEALWAAILAGRLGTGRGILEAADAARAAPAAPQPTRAIDLLLDGLATRFTEGYAAGVPALRRALSAFRGEREIRWLGVAARVAVDLWDDETWHALASRQVQLARDAGALSVLPMALNILVSSHMHAGEFSSAEALLEESDAITDATGSPRLVYGALTLPPWRGDEAQMSELVEVSLPGAVARGEGRAITGIEYASAVLHNGLGRYEDALTAARRAWEHDDLSFGPIVLPELIEAAARSGEYALAVDAVERLCEQTRLTATEWALGSEACSRALVSEGDAADDLYREAIERLGGCRGVVYLARAHLVYGEWLRRERRRLDARGQLRTAYDMFASMGAGGFAARAERELLATGETARRRTVERRDELTAQEAQIARLARDGLSNPEIGTRLFLSPRTIEYHLHKVFAKLDITSRNQLARAL